MNEKLHFLSFFNNLTSKNVIKELSIKLGEYSGHYLTSLACLDKLKLAWKDYCAAKKVAGEL